MPLEKGDNPAVIAHNISTEQAAGKPHAQAVAIALHTAHDADYAQAAPEKVTLREINARNRRLHTRNETDDSLLENWLYRSSK